MSIPAAVGRYRIDRVLGAGAFASVWLGHDDALASPVAIKVLSPSLIDDLDVRNRFLEEARILRRADSERLIRVHDIGELPDGRPYFVMPYADRGTLADRMRARRLSVEEALRLAEEIAYGVEVINRLGLIHRDLKPSNVLFQSAPDGSERLLIADLGLAKALAHASGAFTLPVGTPGYMSPEQARFGGGLDVRADVYGLGALTYHLVAGKAPGPAPVLVPPSRNRPGLSPEVDDVILRAMEVERELRWPTAEAFGRAIAALRASNGVLYDEQPAEGAAASPEGAERPRAEQQWAAQEAPQPPAGPQPVPPAPRFPVAATLVDQPGEAGRPGGTGQPGPGPRPGDRGPQPDPAPQAGPAPQAQPAAPFGQEPASGTVPDDGRTLAFTPGAPGRPPQDAPEHGGPGHGGPGHGGPGHGGPGQGLPAQGGPGPGGQGQQAQDDRTVAFSTERFAGAGTAPPQAGQAGMPPATRQDGFAAATSGPPGPVGAQGDGHGQGDGGPGQGHRPADEGGSASGRRFPVRILVIVAVILVVAVAGGLLVGKLFSGDEKKTEPADPNTVTVSDVARKLSVTVPKEWPKGAEETWKPSVVGLADEGPRPVLRATPDVVRFRTDAENVPGVFVGLTTDVTEGRLPPPNASQHPSACTAKGSPESYRRGTLSGTITRWTGCNGGKTSITEVGLRDAGGKFGLWIRIKQVDGVDRTKAILDSVKATGP